MHRLRRPGRPHRRCLRPHRRRLLPRRRHLPLRRKRLLLHLPHRRRNRRLLRYLRRGHRPLPRRPRQPIGFEERFGTRWVVWVGGVALALGGVFLVRYTIQQGLIGPGVRIALGALLAAALVAAGEWARRQETLSDPTM